MQTLQQRMEEMLAYKGDSDKDKAFNCATVADDHAMAFAEWCLRHANEYDKKDTASLMFHYNRSLEE